MLPRLPLPHVGIDICHIPRIHRLLVRENGHFGKRFVLKLLTKWECDHWRVIQGLSQLEMLKDAAGKTLGSHGPGDGKVQIQTLEKDLYPFARFLSGRWAAKEAIIKAYGNIKPIHRQNVNIIVPKGSNGTSVAPLAYILYQDRNRATSRTKSNKEGLNKNEEGGKQELDFNEAPKSGNSAMKTSELHEREYESESKDVDIDEIGPAGAITTEPKSEINENETVRISISHDAEYATAICLVG